MANTRRKSVDPSKQWFGIPSILGMIALCLTITACEPKIAVRGNLPRDSQLAEIEVGQNNKDQVVRLIGSPSTVSTFDDNVWYYMSRRTEKWAFLEPNIIEHQVLALYFDDLGVLRNIQTYTEEDLREIAASERETPTSGRTFSVIEQVFGNLNRFRN